METIVVCTTCEKPMPGGVAGPFCSPACHTASATWKITNGEGEVEDVAWLVKTLTPQQRQRVVHVSQPYDIYIGDAVPRCGFEQSIWSNQFHCSSKDKLDPAKVKASVRQYAEWLLDQISTGEMTIACIQRSLGGRRLGCWCRKGDGHDTKLCHGLVLVAIMDHDVEAWF